MALTQLIALKHNYERSVIKMQDKAKKSDTEYSEAYLLGYVDGLEEAISDLEFLIQVEKDLK